MKTRVTGGAGFIGSHLCELLVAQGHEVLALDSLVSGRLQNLKTIAGQPGVRFVQADICDSAADLSMLTDPSGFAVREALERSGAFERPGDPFAGLYENTGVAVPPTGPTRIGRPPAGPRSPRPAVPKKRRGPRRAASVDGRGRRPQRRRRARPH